MKKTKKAIEKLEEYIQNTFPELMKPICVIDNEVCQLEKIEELGYDKFSALFKIKKTMKLYKYFPNCDECKNGEKNNHSLDAFINNTVYLQTPILFDDVYDSAINIKWEEYERYALALHCTRFKIDVDKDATSEQMYNFLANGLREQAVDKNDFSKVLTIPLHTEVEKLSCKLFLARVAIELKNNCDVGTAVREVVRSDYDELVVSLKKKFRISCFTTTPYSQLMWATYADYHKGFCLEYTILPDSQIYRQILLKLFPVIYCKERADVAEKLFNISSQDLSYEQMWNIYNNGVLRKSDDWKYQDEWRLVMLLSDNDVENHKVKFFPITKIYLGSNMPTEKKTNIIEICKDKKIEYACIKMKDDIFELQSCDRSKNNKCL